MVTVHVGYFSDVIVLPERFCGQRASTLIAFVNGYLLSPPDLQANRPPEGAALAAVVIALRPTPVNGYPK